MGESGASTIDRARGALVGLACGDAVGTTLEFRAPGSFDPIDDMVGGGPFALEAGQWTDDTSMALCLAESIIDSGGHDPVDQLRRYLLWRDHGYLSSNGRCFDIGNTTSEQLERFRRTGEPYDPLPDQQAAANGSLMRLSPVAIRWHDDIAKATERAADSSRTTHSAQRPVDACRVLGAMTAALIAGEPWGSVASTGFWQYGPLNEQIEAIVEGSWRTREPPDIRGTGFCVDALEAAIWAVAGADDYGEAILRAANLGNDADTTAAIAGQLGGARWGARGIPPDWQSKVAHHERIRSLAYSLFDRATRSTAAAGTSGANLPPGVGADSAQLPPRWEHEDLVHAWWVQPGRVLAGEYPGHTEQPSAFEKLSVLVDRGVRTFVDLTTPADRLEPYNHLVEQIAANRNLQLKVLTHRIPDMSVTTHDHYDRIVADLHTASERGVAYVHCWGGIGRTGTVVGCLLADHGMAADDVFTTIDALRAGSSKDHMAAPQAETQRQIIRERSTG